MGGKVAAMNIALWFAFGYMLGFVSCLAVVLVFITSGKEKYEKT